MAFPKLSLPDLGSVKSKLGFQDKQDEYGEYDEYDNYDEYDEYENSYGDSYEDYVDYRDYRDEYGTYDEYETSRGRHATAAASRDNYLSASAEAGSTRALETKPRLASADDVRVTSSSLSSNFDNAYTTRNTGSASYTYRPVSSTVGTSSTIPERRSEGLDSLFGSTDKGAGQSSIWDRPSTATSSNSMPSVNSVGMATGIVSDFVSPRGSTSNTSDFSRPRATSSFAADTNSAFAGTSTSSFTGVAGMSNTAYAADAEIAASSQEYGYRTVSTADSYDAFAGAGVKSGSRALVVVKPSSYADVERIAKPVRSGDVVILALRNTPDNLSKRVLDFSFGVASALNARVDCVADKVFALTCGDSLTQSEQLNLRSQGVL